MERAEEGTHRLRREDPTLLTGSAEYTEDLQPADVVHAAILRCPYGHVRVERVDVSPATGMAGVVAAFGAAELAEAGGPKGFPTTNYFPGPDVVERPLLVDDRAPHIPHPVTYSRSISRHAILDLYARSLPVV